MTFKMTLGERMAVIETNMVTLIRSMAKGDKRMNKIEADVSETNKLVNTMHVDVSLITKSINGNGVPGISTRLTTVEGITDEHTSFFDRAKGALWMVGSIGVLNIVIMLVNIWRK